MQQHRSCTYVGKAKYGRAAVPYLKVEHGFHTLACDIPAEQGALGGTEASTDVHQQHTVLLAPIKSAYMHVALSGSPLGSSIH